VLYDVFLYTQTDAKGQPGYLIEHDSRPSEAPPLLNLLKRYVLRSKVRIRDTSDEFKTWSTWGTDTHRSWDTTREWSWAKSGVAEPVWTNVSHWPWGEENLVLQDRRAPGMGTRMLVRKGDKRTCPYKRLNIYEAQYSQRRAPTITTFSRRMITRYTVSCMGCLKDPRTLCLRTPSQWNRIWT
jgi:folate-binding Fe-S cluster repair protein YgfZ